MFPGAYFAKRYFPGQYFEPVAGAPTPPSPPSGQGMQLIHWLAIRRRRRMQDMWSLR